MLLSDVIVVKALGPSSKGASFVMICRQTCGEERASPVLKQKAGGRAGQHHPVRHSTVVLCVRIDLAPDITDGTVNSPCYIQYMYYIEIQLHLETIGAEKSLPQ